MWSFDKKSRKKWQKEYIDTVFSKKVNRADTYTRILLRNLTLLDQKIEHFPKTFCKYYSPTSNNILDVQKQRLWLSHPNSFNDPFDCNIGFDTEDYEKRRLLEYIKRKIDSESVKNGDSFTEEEYWRIYHSRTDLDISKLYADGIKEYSSVKWDILRSKNKKLEYEIHGESRAARQDAFAKIEKLRTTNIRIACFSEFNRYDNFKKNIQMWSHYADNHRGFCVEYDLSDFKEKTVLNFEDYHFYTEPENFINERLKAAIQGGLFSVIYSSQRVNFPTTKLLKLKVKDIGIQQNRNDIDILLYKTFIIKSTNWSYEKEWRLILDGKIPDHFENKIPFPYIKRIYLGCMMDSQTMTTMIEIAKELNIEIFFLTMDNKKFMLEENDISILSYRKEKQIPNNPFSYDSV